MSLPVAGSIAVQRPSHAAAEPASDDAGVAAHDIGEAGEPEPGVHPGGPDVTPVTVSAPATVYAPATAPAPATVSAPATAPAPPAGQPWRRLARSAGHALAGGSLGRHLALLACYTAAGIAVTWPRATWLAEGKLPATRDGGVYVWDFWWMAHAVEHLTTRGSPARSSPRPGCSSATTP